MFVDLLTAIVSLAVGSSMASEAAFLLFCCGAVFSMPTSYLFAECLLCAGLLCTAWATQSRVAFIVLCVLVCLAQLRRVVNTIETAVREAWSAYRSPV